MSKKIHTVSSMNFIFWRLSLTGIAITTLSGYLYSEQDYDVMGFLGVFFSFFMLIHAGRLIFNGVYSTWLGPLLGGNVDLRKLGQWAVVTGATDGIGLEYARQLAQLGLDIVLMSRSLERLEKVAGEIESKYGVRTKVIQVDFGEGVEMYEEIGVEAQLQGLDIAILINNVGMTYEAPEYFHVVSSSSAFVRKMINLNVTAVTMMTRAVLPGMLERGKGAVVNVGSVVSLYGMPFFAMYAATKSFMETLTMDLELEYKDKGILFQYQSPGYVLTKIAKLKEGSWVIPSPEEYARAGLRSIGIQQQSCIWTAQRVSIPFISILRFLFPQQSRIYHLNLAKSFWLFAQQKKMDREKAKKQMLFV